MFRIFGPGLIIIVFANLALGAIAAANYLLFRKSSDSINYPYATLIDLLKQYCQSQQIALVDLLPALSVRENYLRLSSRDLTETTRLKERVNERRQRSARHVNQDPEQKQHDDNRRHPPFLVREEKRQNIAQQPL
jgi:hypothetical protein